MRRPFPRHAPARSRPSVRSIALAAALLLGPAAREARALIVYVTFPSLTLIEGGGPGGSASGLTTLAWVNGTGTNPGIRDLALEAGGAHSQAAGEYHMAEFDPRWMDSYVVPFELELFDAGLDWPASAVDIAPGPGTVVRGELDLETGAYTPAGPAEGDGPGPRAILDYRIEADPFVYDFTVGHMVTPGADGMWTYQYNVHNHSRSTFDLLEVDIPGLWSGSLGLEPGYDRIWDPFRSDRPPVYTWATATYGDLRGTRVAYPHPILVPEPLEAVPEPSAASLFAGGLLGLMWWKRRGGRRLPRSGRRGT